MLNMDLDFVGPVVGLVFETCPKVNVWQSCSFKSSIHSFSIHCDGSRHVPPLATEFPCRAFGDAIPAAIEPNQSLPILLLDFLHPSSTFVRIQELFVSLTHNEGLFTRVTPHHFDLFVSLLFLH